MVERTRREQQEILDALTRFLAVGSLVALVPSVWASVVEKLWVVAVVDLAAWVVVLAVAYIPGVPFMAKLITVIAGSMGVGIVVLVFTGPFGAGYIWFMAAAVLSALLGRRSLVLLAIAGSAILMGAWALAIHLGAPGHGSTPMTIGIIGSNLVLICLGLALVIRGLVERLDGALLESQEAAEALAVQLEDKRRAKDEIARSLEEKEVLLRELHHRVRNNLQVVLSILGMEDPDKPGWAETAVRRVRALVLANDLAMDSPDDLSVDAADLFRIVLEHTGGEPALREAIDSALRQAAALRQAGANGGGPVLNPQTASLVAMALADGLALLDELPGGSGPLGIGVYSHDGATGVEIRSRAGVDPGLARKAVEGFFAGSLARAIARRVRSIRLDASDGSGAGFALEIRQRASDGAA
ncbi:MAG: sensor histidine kinase [Spirochaetales bacterium]|nr:sensor histidine kinase [Spirochaetales bacterium]